MPQAQLSIGVTAADTSMASTSVSSLVRKFISVRGIPTCLLKAGEIEENSSTSPRRLFLVIPGNPGVVDFYDKFQSELYSASEGAVPVWGVSHAGHMELPKDMKSKTGGSDLYDLEDQINHKIAFIEDHVPENTQLVLIGHSIGCYIILEIMRRKPKLTIQKSLLLFPTIERMALTPNGVVAKPLALYFRWLAFLCCSLAYYLPTSAKQFLLGLHLSGEDMNPTASASAVNLFNPHCLNNVIYMGGLEMLQVTDVDVITIEQNLQRLVFYYGRTDKWCPIEFYEDMKKKFPEGIVLLDNEGMNHAFCLKSSSKMAEVIWKWMKKEV